MCCHNSCTEQLWKQKKKTSETVLSRPTTGLILGSIIEWTVIRSEEHWEEEEEDEEDFDDFDDFDDDDDD